MTPWQGCGRRLASLVLLLGVLASCRKADVAPRYENVSVTRADIALCATRRGGNQATLS